MSITLAAGDAIAEIATLGAEPLRWSVGGRPLLWTPDPTWWARTSPILFPLIAATRNDSIRVDGVTYPTAGHGFAPQSEFKVIHQSSDAVTLELAADDATRAIFPFDFRLRAQFTLQAAALRLDLTVANDGKRDLPYSIGFHPGFLWPFAGGAKDGYSVVFEHAEEPMVPVHDSQRLLTTQRRQVPLEGRTLSLSDSVFEPGGMVFLNAHSRSVAFVAPDGSAIDIAVEDMPHLVLWTRAGAPFLCLEGWTGHADPAGFSGEFADKPSTRHLPVGQTAHHAMTMGYRAGATPKL